MSDKDTIYRQDAINALHTEIVKRRISEDVNDDGSLDEFDTEDILRKLPSAHPDEVAIQLAYMRGKIDGIKECTEKLRKLREEFE